MNNELYPQQQLLINVLTKINNQMDEIISEITDLTENQDSKIYTRYLLKQSKDIEESIIELTESMKQGNIEDLL